MANITKDLGSAMLWTSSDGMIDLNTLMGANSGFSYLFEATAINDNGQEHAFLMTHVGSPVPLPGAVWLLSSGLVGLAGLRRKKKSAAA